jgi:hypothetical protein
MSGRYQKKTPNKPAANNSTTTNLLSLLQIPRSTFMGQVNHLTYPNKSSFLKIQRPRGVLLREKSGNGTRVAMQQIVRMDNYGVSRFASLLLIALSTLSAGAAAQKGLQGSAHDFSRAAWNISKDLCSPCHQGHSSPNSATQALWGHTAKTANFRPYDSPTFRAGKHAPSGVSLACLSCHDGTVAINQRLEGAEAVYISTANQVGPDLHTTHPVSFTYDASLAAANGKLEDPTTYRIGDPKNRLSVNTPPVPVDWTGSSLLSQTIDGALLFNHKVECASCHDVHKLEGSAPESFALLRVDGCDASGRGDLLCRTCHIR